MEENQQSNINFIPCVKWVKKGVAKSNPEKVQLSKQELVRIIKQTKTSLRLTDNENDENEGSTSQNDQMNVDDEYNFSKYDEEDEQNPQQVLGIDSLADIPEDAEDHFSESDDSEKEDDVIKAKDNLILAGRVEGDASVLEVYVYNESEGSLYVHHDFLLPAFPLCLEWLDHEAGHPAGNYCAIGTMNSIIEVWDLDIVNCLEPAFKLGRKGNRKKGIARVGHADAVLDLAWNKNYDHILASASVDKSIILWDLDEYQPATNINAFTDKVQCLQWHKFEAQTLLAGSCDKTAKVFDCRSPESHQTWQLTGEAERVAWNKLDPFLFFAATSVGDVQYFDCRQDSYNAVSISECQESRKMKQLSQNLNSSGKFECECYPQCNGLMYNLHRDKTMKILMKGYETFDPDDSVLTVYYNTNGCIKMESETYVSWHQFLGTIFIPKEKREEAIVGFSAIIGGIFGLCLGGSLISVLECVHFAILKITVKRKEKTAALQKPQQYYPKDFFHHYRSNVRMRLRTNKIQNFRLQPVTKAY